MAGLLNAFHDFGGAVADTASSGLKQLQQLDAAQTLQQGQQQFTGGQNALQIQASKDLQTQKAEQDLVKTQLENKLIAEREASGRVQAADIANKALPDAAKLYLAFGGTLPGYPSSGGGASQAPSSGTAPPPRESYQDTTSTFTPSDKSSSSSLPTMSDTSTMAPTPSALSGGVTSPLDNPIVRNALGFPKSGSDEDVRAMLMHGVNTDPKFKNASETERASEFLTRYNISKMTPTNLSEGTQDMIADRVIAGDKSAMAELGFGNSGASNRAAVEERITKKLTDAGMGGADLAAAVARFSGEQAGARAAGTREAQVSQAVFEAKLMLPIALKASENFSRTDYPTLNGLFQAVAKGTGNSQATMLAGATNSFLNAYARAVTPIGQPTEGAQNRAREILDASWSKGQYQDQMGLLMQEMSAAQQSPILTQNAQRERISGRAAPEPSSAATPPSSTTTSPATTAPAAVVPSWVRPGDDYSPSRGLARDPGGKVYGPPQ